MVLQIDFPSGQSVHLQLVEQVRHGAAGAGGRPADAAVRRDFQLGPMGMKHNRQFAAGFTLVELLVVNKDSHDFAN